LLDVGDVLRWRDNPFSQNRLPDVPHIDEIIINRSDVELDVEMAA